MPDYFVPLDTNKYTKYHRDLVRNGSILQATLRYIDNNRQSLQEKYPTVDKFIANYEVDEQLLSLLREQGEADSVKIEGGGEEYTRSLPQITRQLKALVARDIWGSGEYLQIMNADNEIFNKALELIKEPNMDAVLTKRRKK